MAAEAGTFEVATVPDPSPAADEVLVRVEACGLCGSDLKARGAFPVGTIMGHEFGGRVVAQGSDTGGRLKGRHVSVLPVASCGACAWCRQGYVAHCADADLFGLGGRPGGFAELVAVPTASVFEVPDAVNPRHTALVEPFAVGLHCVAAGNIGEGDDVLVIGAGTVGLTTAAWAHQRRAGQIVMVDPNADRRRMSAAFGATDALADAREAPVAEFDVVVECVGQPGLLDLGITALRPRGRLVVAGTCAEPDPFWSIAALLKEASIQFAVYYTPQEFRTVIQAFADGTLDPGPLVGRTMPLPELDDAFAQLAAGSINGKILLVP